MSGYPFIALYNWSHHLEPNPLIGMGGEEEKLQLKGDD